MINKQTFIALALFDLVAGMTKHFPAARWPFGLKLVSSLGSLLILGIGMAAYRAIPVPTGFTHGFGLAIAFVPVAILFFSLLFVVTGYDLEGADLLVRRLFWSTRIPLAGLRQIYADPWVCKGSIRLFGNGGLFAFTGLYRNKKLGNYRLFATDFSCAVVLILPKRTVVITPAWPDLFIHHVAQAFPSAMRGEDRWPDIP